MSAMTFVACSTILPSASGVSDEAAQLNGFASQISERYESSQALFGDKSRLIVELHDIATECDEDDWDGYGAEAVTVATLLRAEALIRSLPDHLPLPEVSAEPDGAIAFDWMPLPSKTLTLSVNGGNRLAYAWIDGTDRGHAAVKFEGTTIPSRVLAEIERLTDHAVTLRSA